FVYIVTGQNVIQHREVRAPQIHDNMWGVEKGLTADDWVVESPSTQAKPLKDGITVRPLKRPAAGPPSLSQGKRPAVSTAAEQNVPPVVVGSSRAAGEPAAAAKREASNQPPPAQRSK
ncbi:MAG: hypothetical protein ABSG53_14285, partial [Thermoguttaceae bacterium]